MNDLAREGPRAAGRRDRTGTVGGTGKAPPLAALQRLQRRMRQLNYGVGMLLRTAARLRISCLSIPSAMRIGWYTSA